jgi:hypothetical protein
MRQRIAELEAEVLYLEALLKATEEQLQTWRFPQSRHGTAAPFTPISAFIPWDRDKSGDTRTLEEIN